MDVENARKKRKTKEVVFARYCQDKRKFNDCLFCFFEGEDIKYYSSRIEEYSGYSFDKIIHYACGGKDGVLYNLSKTKDDELYKRAFFIDKDYDCDDIETSPHLYVTPCYSIENFYISNLAFKKLLNREFGINPTDEDMTKVSNDYNERLKEFNQCTLIMNAWLACQRTKEKEMGKKDGIVLKDFKVSKLFSEISIDKITCKEEITIDKMKSLFPNFIEITDILMNEKIALFRNDQFGLLSRGKFQIDYLRKIIHSLILKNKNRDYFSKEYTSVRINPEVNILSALSDYADTPQCLIEFLQQYKVA